MIFIWCFCSHFNSFNLCIWCLDDDFAAAFNLDRFNLYAIKNKINIQHVHNTINIIVIIIEQFANCDINPILSDAYLSFEVLSFPFIISVSTVSCFWFCVVVSPFNSGDFVGDNVGDNVGCNVGFIVGSIVGIFVGIFVGYVGVFVGYFVGNLLGDFDGNSVGYLLGEFDGYFVGNFVGYFEGDLLGNIVGYFVGWLLGTGVGFNVGAAVGFNVGAGVGLGVGDGVGFGVGERVGDCWCKSFINTIPSIELLPLLIFKLISTLNE